MVSVDRRDPLEADLFFSRHSRVGRPFPSRTYPQFTSLFDESDVLLQNLKDMKMRSSFLDTVFPVYSGIRHGRYNSYDISNPVSDVMMPNLIDRHQPSGNATFIPIKVEHVPEKYQDPGKTFRLLNGSLKYNSASENDSKLLLGHSFQEFDDISSIDSAESISSSSKKYHNKYIRKSQTYSDQEIKPDSKANCPANFDCSLNSRDELPASSVQHDFQADNTEKWTLIPVKHIEASKSTVADEELNSNNNSSRRRYSSTPRSQASSKVQYSRENSNISNIHNSRSRVSYPPSSTSISSEPDHGETAEPCLKTTVEEDFELPQFEHDEIVSPPNCQIYRDLKVRLSREDRKIDYIEGDGNCLFRALSKGLYGSEKYHKAVRMFIVNLIGTNKSVFAQFVDDEDVEEHINRMCKDGCWATTCEIYAAATLLQRDIFMLTPDHMNEKYSWLLFQPVFNIKQSLSVANAHPCYITLCNTNGNHYDRIVPDHGGCNCFLPHPELDGLSTDSSISADTSSADTVSVQH